MKGAWASLARRRAISVLPTPVGPIMRMFLGVISLRSASSTCIRRQRLRSAIATARLALAWPMMCLSSSWTISRGVIDMETFLRCCLRQPLLALSREFLDGEVAVGVDADVAGDVERFLDDLACRQVGILDQRGGSRLRKRAAEADGDQLPLGFHHIAVARNHQNGVLIGDDQQRFQAAQHAVAAPVLGHFHGGAGEVAAVLLQLALEALEQRERIGGAAGEAGYHAVVEQPSYLAGVALHDGIAQCNLAVAADGDRAVAANREYGRASELFHAGA